MRSQVAAISVIFACSTVESVTRPLALLIFGGDNPTLYVPFGLVPSSSESTRVLSSGPTRH